jgi:cytosine/uracil/thiamine/allantoin permease
VVEVSPFWKNLYHYAWFTGFLVAMGLYRLLMGRGKAEKV